MRKSKKRLDKIDVIFILLSIAFFAFFIWKARFGEAKKDECFYLSIPYRFYQGDAPMVNEKNIGQWFAFILYPLVKVYLDIFKSLDGIMLNFRYIYVFFQVLTSILLYFRLKRINKIGSLVASIVFLIYCPYNLMALSYNTMAIMSLTLCLAIFVTNPSKLEMYICGLLLAISVLCNPYLLVLYVIYTLVMIYKSMKKKELYEVFSFSNWLLLTLGSGTLAILFFAFLFSRISFSQFIDFLSTFNIEDPEHPSQTFIEVIFTYFKEIFNFSKLSFIFLAMIIIIIVIFAVDKNKEKHKNYFYFISTIVCGLYLIDIVEENQKLINYLFIPISLLGLLFIIFNFNKENKKILVLFYVPAIIYTICSHFASNMLMKTISSTYCIALTISVVVIIDTIKKVYSKSLIDKLLKLSIAILLFGFTSIELIERALWVFSYQYTFRQTEYIDKGPFKGLYVTEKIKENYLLYCEIIDYIRENETGNSVLFLTIDNCMYLIANDYRCASPSSWATLHTYGCDLVNDYFESGEIEQPDIIYVNDEFEPVVEDMIDIIDNYTKKEIINGEIIYIRNK